MPSVSVILPTHNREKVLERSIQSVLRQTFHDFELIVVDDASTDGTRELVAGIQDARLRLLSLEKNGGVARARNTGIAAASADWVAFQDSDDEWLPEKLAQQMALARSASASVGLILAGYQAASPAGPLAVTPVETLAGRDPIPDLLDGWPIITPTWLVRRRLLQELGGFDETFGCLEDWDLVLRL